MSDNYYKDGQWNIQCDVCGRKRKSSQGKLTWDGYWACFTSKCWYPKHPNDYPRPQLPIDNIPVPIVRVYNTTFIDGQTGTTHWIDDGLLWESITWTWEDDNGALPNPYIWG